MVEQDELLSLIEDVYAAAGDFSRWPQTLQRIADAFEAQEASLSAVTPRSVGWLLAPRTDPDFLASYGAYYHPLNRFWHCMRQLPAGTAASDQMLLPKRELRGSEFYNDWSRPQGYLAVMGATLLIEDGWRFEFVVPGRHDFGPEHLKLYDALAPHLRRALQLSRRLGAAETMRAASVEALQWLEQGVVLVDAQAKVLFSNRAAQPAFAAGDGLRLRDGILATAVADATARLQALIAGCGRAGATDHGGTVAVARGSGRLPLSLLVVPLHQAIAIPPGAGAAAAVFVADPEAVSVPELAQLQDQYGLTRAEAAVALELLKGDGMPAVAERLGVLVGTARTHLHRVLAKTGTRGQADLVRLILASRHGVRRDKNGP